MRSRILIATVAVFAAVLMTTTTNAEKQLRWKAKAGERFHVVLSTESKQTITMGPQTIEIPSSLKIEQVWDIKKVDEQGNLDIEAKVNRVSIKATTPLGKAEYDSASKEKPAGQLAPIFASLVKPLVGMKSEVTMSSRGKVLKFKNDPAAAKKMQAAPGIGGALPPGAIEKMLVGASPELPVNLSPGDTWENVTESNSPGGGSMKLSNKYTYVGEEKKDGSTLDRIDVKSDIEQKGNVKAMGMELKIVDQSNSGKLLFDNDAGYLLSAEAKQKLTMESEGPGGQKMTLAGPTTTTVTFKKLKPGEEPAGSVEDSEDDKEEADDDAIIID